MNLSKAIEELKKHPEHLQKLSQAKSKEEWMSTARTVFASLGWDVSEEEIQNRFQERELSDDELDAVAGGVMGTYF